MARRDNQFRVNPRAYGGIIRGAPYKVFQQNFDLQDYMLDFEHQENPNTPPQFISASTQEDFWLAALDKSIDDWTMIISGSTIVTADAAALTIAGRLKQQGVGCVWIPLTANRFGRDQNILDRFNSSGDDLGVIVISGLHFEGDLIRYDKLRDILQLIGGPCRVIITAAGANPIAFARKANIEIGMAINLDSISAKSHQL